MKKILFLNSAPIIKYGMELGFQKIGWETRHLTFPEETGSEGLQKVIDTFKPDYVFNENLINTSGWMWPVLESTGVPLIIWCIEDPIWPELSNEWAERAALVATPCVEEVETYHKKGYKAICIPFAVDTEMHTNVFNPKYADYDAVFVGNNYNYYGTRKKGYRDVIQPFIDKQLNLRVYGNPEWLNPDHEFNIPEEMYGKYMKMEDTIEVFSSAKINIGVHSVVKSATMQSMRTFEVLGCAGFYLSSYAKSLDTFFNNHIHLIYSDSPEETNELIDFYLPREDLRKEIAWRGREEVCKNHTYEHRAQRIADALKFREF